MPTNKNAQLRYQIIDKCLSNWSRRYYIEDLVDACNDTYSGAYPFTFRQLIRV